MKFKVFHIGFFMAVCGLFFVSCTKDKKIEPVTNNGQSNIPASEKTSLVVNFEALLNNQPLNLTSTKFFTNYNSDSITVNKFNYYISNIKLKTVGGTTYAEPESYHLVRHEDVSTTNFTIQNIPEGIYNSIEFIIGVDSARNVSGAQTGDLDPAYTMFWDWNNGYIFFKLEGDFKSFTTPAGSNYAMHIGGYSGQYNCLQKCTFNALPVNINIVKGKASKIHYHVIVDEVFKNPNVIDIDSYFSVQLGKNAQTVAINYSDMFVVDKVEN